MNKEELFYQFPVPPNTIIDADKQGFILAPGESVEDLLQRKEKLLKGIEELNRLVSQESFTCGSILLKEENRIPEAVISPIIDTLDIKLGIRPDWIPGFYVSSGLGILGGGGIFSGTDKEKDITVTFFVLREEFKNKEKWIIYERDEILLHEAIHSARSGFYEPLFEEAIAYRYGSSKFRKYLGGGFRSVTLSNLIFLSMICFWIGAILPLYAYNSLITTLLKIPLPVLFGYIIIDGIYRQLQIEKAVKVLQPLFGQNSESVLLRLSDKEILELTKIKESSELYNWILTKTHEPRWQIIISRFLYF